MIWLGIMILAVLFIIFFTSIKIKIEYKRSKENDHIHIECSAWWNIIKLQYDIPMVQLQSMIKGVSVKQKAQTGPKKAPTPKKRFRLTPRDVHIYLRRFYRLKKQVHDFNEISKKLFKHIRCDQLEWYTNVGVGDAAATGIFTGVVWSIKSILVGVMSHYLTLQTIPKMKVVPAFQGKDINTQLLCILRFRIGNVIIAGTRILFKFRKGREGLWQNTLFRA